MVLGISFNLVFLLCTLVSQAITCTAVMSELFCSVLCSKHMLDYCFIIPTSAQFFNTLKTNKLFKILLRVSTCRSILNNLFVFNVLKKK